MKVAFFSSEVFPFAKTGGLADVSGALPLALEEAGAEVKIFMPFYKQIKPEVVHDKFGLSRLGKNIEIIFIRNDNYFFRDYLYNTPLGDYPDNLERFSFFCRKALEIIKDIGFFPDIFHCNDWQTSLIPLYLEALYAKEGVFKNSKTVFTIHNLAYQGIFGLEKFTLLGVSQEFASVLRIHSKLNLLKAGIVKAFRVNTVSPSYAEEIQTRAFGCGLERVLKQYESKISGILNAIDYNVWNPLTDELIYFKYDQESLDKKIENKLALQKECGLSVDKDKFLLGMVSRLAEQKGLDILTSSLPKILRQYQLILLGTGEKKYHDILAKLSSKYPKNISLHLKFDEALAHKIYACSDVFLLPSRFEPCGLSQMISFKYATLPLVHATGGLKDTVIDCFQSTKDGNGFVFSKYAHFKFIKTITKAASLYQDKEIWTILQRRICGLNFSWQKVAKDYLNLYNQCFL